MNFVDGRLVGPKEPVVTGFVSRDQKALHGAPVGMAQASDGALLIADDFANTVWGVTAAH